MTVYKGTEHTIFWIKLQRKYEFKWKFPFKKCFKRRYFRWKSKIATYMVKDITKAFRHKANIGSFTPNQQIQPYVKKLWLLCGSIGWNSAWTFFTVNEDNFEPRNKRLYHLLDVWLQMQIPTPRNIILKNFIHQVLHCITMYLQVILEAHESV